MAKSGDWMGKALEGRAGAPTSVRTSLAMQAPRGRSLSQRSARTRTSHSALAGRRAAKPGTARPRPQTEPLQAIASSKSFKQLAQMQPYRNVSYVTDRVGHGRLPGQKVRPRELDFVVPASSIPESSHIVEKWPIMPAEEGVHALKGSPRAKHVVKGPNLTYDDDSETWNHKVFPSRLPAKREEVLMLRNWLAAKCAGLNSEYQEREADYDVLDFVGKGTAVYDQAMHELSRQVMVHCEERGMLLADIWAAHSHVFAKSVAHFRKEIAGARREAEEAKAKAEEADAVRLDSQIEAAIAKTKLEEEIARLQQEKQRLKGLRGDGRRNPSVSMPTLHAGVPAAQSPSPVRKQASRRFSRKASIMTHTLQQELQARSMELEQLAESSASMEEENMALKNALNNAQNHLELMEDEIAKLEKEANGAIVWQGRAEYAENLMEDMQYKQRAMTPRPRRDFGPDGEDLEADVRDYTDKILQTQSHHSDNYLAQMLVGAGTGIDFEANEECFADFAETITNSRGRFTRDTLHSTLKEGTYHDLADLCSPETIEFIEEALREGLPIPLLCDFLTGTDTSLRPVPRELFGVLHGKAKVKDVAKVLFYARTPTAARVETMTDRVKSQEAELLELKMRVQQFEEVQQKREYARIRRQEEVKLKKKTPLDTMLDYWKVADENEWKDNFQSIGMGKDVPGFLQANGLIRNRNMSKRDTEKLVKEIWKDKAKHDAKSNAKSPMEEYTNIHLQKKMGVAQGVVELGYNFIYSLQRYDYDADCELFLKILMGQVREEVYFEQLVLQTNLEELFAQTEKGGSGGKKGTIAKGALTQGLESYFKVGQKGGKSVERFQELLEALDKDQPDEEVVWKKLFEEDREYNQGEFAETVRDQYLEERLEYFKELESTLYDQTNFEENCTASQLENALCFVDPDIGPGELKRVLEMCFPMKGKVRTETNTIRNIMTFMQQGVGRKSKAADWKKVGHASGAIKKAKGKKGRRSSTKKLL